jgi:Ni,Fe-hydrogenase III large subunit/Ni,Fe-hydrogenase III component G
MTLLAGLQKVVDDIEHRFPGQLEWLPHPAANEAQAEAPAEVLQAICAFIYRRELGTLAMVFADDVRAESRIFHVYYVFKLPQAHGFLVARVPVPEGQPEFTSLTNAIPAVNWQEREIQDLFGLKLVGHPNPRRCALHDDWPEVHPLCKDFPVGTTLPPFAGERHKFRSVEGEGVFQVPVGPVHAGIIEPGHFLFSVAGEPVLYLQLRMFYVHKGTEKLFENMPVAHGVRLAESISGDSSFAHATAFCHAVERAAGIEAPPRARALRTACLELERLYNHFGDIGAIATDVAFVTANMHAMRLKEQVLRLNEELTGSRLLRGVACLGGVRGDWDAGMVERLRQALAALQPDFDSLVALLRSSSSTRDRLETTGILKPEIAADLGVVGVAGRASDYEGDMRRDFPHAGYEGLEFSVPVYREGDVLRRVQVRVEEVGQAMRILEQVLAALPPGPTRVSVGELPSGRSALGYVEGWRGEIFHWIRTLPGNRLGRCKVKDPSLQNWPALSEAILGNIVPDFPVVNKSFNLSYSGTDR